MDGSLVGGDSAAGAGRQQEHEAVLPSTRGYFARSAEISDNAFVARHDRGKSAPGFVFSSKAPIGILFHHQAHHQVRS
jgi:hypothetical protein